MASEVKPRNHEKTSNFNANCRGLAAIHDTTGIPIALNICDNVGATAVLDAGTANITSKEVLC